MSNCRSCFYQFEFLTTSYSCRSLSYKEIGAAMEKLFVEFAPALLEKVTQLMGFDKLNGDEDDWKTHFSIGPDEFVSVCCLANRILCQEDIV